MTMVISDIIVIIKNLKVMETEHGVHWVELKMLQAIHILKPRTVII